MPYRYVCMEKIYEHTYKYMHIHAKCRHMHRAHIKRKCGAHINSYTYMHRNIHTYICTFIQNVYTYIERIEI